MKILVAQYHGFCYGVQRAVDMAQSCIGSDANTVTLGPIIHNPQMVNKLAEQGIGVINNLAEIEAATVVIRSHGVGPDIYEEAQAKNLRVVDATCPHVKKAQQAAHELSQEGYDVVIVGEKKHPEVKSILEWSGSKATVVETVEEALAVPFTPKLGVVAQTTFAGAAFEEIVAKLKSKTESLKVSRTICTATEQRQQAAVDLAAQVDIMVVIGGKNSANTGRLAQLCRQTGCKTYHIETAQEMEQEWFAGVSTAGITAGASTPEWLVKEVYNKMQEFDQLVNHEVTELTTGSIVKGTVVSVRKDEVFVDVGYKAEGIIPLAELAYPVPENAANAVKVGDIVDVYVMSVEGEGGLRLSKSKADQRLVWDKLEHALDQQEAVEGIVLEAIKGGLAVAVLGIRGFIPASQVDLRYVEDLSQFVGRSLNLLPIEIDRSKQRVVLSRKIVLQEEQRRKEQELFASLAVNQVIQGTVKRIVDYGVFVDIGGFDGLVHISDLSWERVKTPHEVVNIGDQVTVMVTKLDAMAKKISLSLKQVVRDPWFDAVEQFFVGRNYKGKVTKLAKFGAFVKLGTGIEGLIRLSELSEKRVTTAEEVVHTGDEVTVKVLEIDKANKRMALSIIQAQHDAERAEYLTYLNQQTSTGTTLGDKFGHLFKHED